MVSRLTCRNGAIVAGKTSANGIAVIERCRQPRNRTMVAIFTGIRRGYVTPGFTRSSCPVMAAIATARDTVVIESRRCPGNSQVAVTAVIATLNMIGGLAFGLYTIVAGLTGAGDRGMVHPGITPAKFRMAIVTGITALNMSRAFLGRGNRTCLTVATCTASGCTSKNTVGVTRLAT